MKKYIKIYNIVEILFLIYLSSFLILNIIFKRSLPPVIIFYYELLIFFVLFMYLFYILFDFRKDTFGLNAIESILYFIIYRVGPNENFKANIIIFTILCLFFIFFSIIKSIIKKDKISVQNIISVVIRSLIVYISIIIF